jgi:hypothetical protein
LQQTDGLFGLQAIEQRVQRLDALVTGRTLIGRVGDEQRRFIGSGEKDMGECVNGLTGREVAFFGGAFKHGADGSESVHAFEFTPFNPSQHGGSLDEQYPLDVGREGCIQEANEALPQLIQCAVGWIG